MRRAGAIALGLSMVLLVQATLSGGNRTGAIIQTSDTIPPTVHIDYPSGPGTFEEAVIAPKGTASDSGTGLQRVEIQLNGGAWLDAFVYFSPDHLSGEWVRGGMRLVEGPNNLEARAWDVAGNPSSIVSVNFTMKPYDLLIRVHPEKAAFSPGEPVNYSFDMTNVGNETAYLWWTNGCSEHDVVEDQNGTQWFDSSTRGGCAPAFVNITLAPGEVYNRSGSWDQRDDSRNPVPFPGCYILWHYFTRFENIPEEPALFGIGNAPFNTAPHAAFAIAPGTGDTTTHFVADATGSFDCQDTSRRLEFRWDWSGDGTWDTDWTHEKMAEHAYTELGTHTIRLEVRDSAGWTATANRSVTVEPAIDQGAPVIHHVPPAQVARGEDAVLWADVTDDGPISRVQLVINESGSPRSLDMTSEGAETYSVRISVPSLSSELRYHLVADDAAGHQSRLPASSEFVVAVVALGPPVTVDPLSLGIGLGLGAVVVAAIGFAIVLWQARRIRGRPPGEP